MTPLPQNMRPREKLIQIGVHSLSDIELLALLLRSGNAQSSVFHLSHQLIEKFNGLSGLLHASAKELQSIKGLGPAKSSELVAVMELSRRCLEEPLRLREGMHDPQTVGRYLQAKLGRYTHEVFSVMFLDSQHRLIALEEMFRGSLNQASVYPREVVLRALQHSAAAVVLAHNHPSGCQEPSNADWNLTHHLEQALRLIDIEVLDHFIITSHHWSSLRQKGWHPGMPLK